MEATDNALNTGFLKKKNKRLGGIPKHKIPWKSEFNVITKRLKQS